MRDISPAVLQLVQSKLDNQPPAIVLRPRPMSQMLCCHYFQFSAAERLQLERAFLELEGSPYAAPASFLQQVASLAMDRAAIPVRFADFMAEVNANPRTYTAMSVCPRDLKLELPSLTGTLESKLLIKTTFITEAFLLLYTYMVRCLPLRYETLNQGHVVHDILSTVEGLLEQSQKAALGIGFHTDLARNPVSPDYVPILGLLGGSPITAFTRLVDVIDRLSEAERELASQPLFFTPLDVLTLRGMEERGQTPVHMPDYALISNQPGVPLLRFFEGRTQARTSEAQAVMARIIQLLHQEAQPLVIGSGDFVCANNLQTLHSKVIPSHATPVDLLSRWLQKCVIISASRVETISGQLEHDASSAWSPLSHT